ncbi:MAG: SGNH/GDSL hydrolase family protein [Ignavibacteriales bacterium]|nr:MAG: SGNH/GDSL hydrolase family protein [Ignavibacteriales bacterium]
MKTLLFLLILCSFNYSQETQPAVAWYSYGSFTIEGLGSPDSLRETPYDRMPVKWKDKVRKPVWDLSKNTAGVTVRFNSNTTSIRLKWTVLNDLKMNHMAETGIKGIDLYAKLNSEWIYINTSRPQGKYSESKLIGGMKPETREYLLYLPLYDGVTDLQIGVDSSSTFNAPEKSREKPIVYYGTSIAQGGCASRPGMAHTNILSRMMGTEIINLGFSGNGRMELPIAEFMAETDARFYVLDNIPNMKLEEVLSNVRPFITYIRSRRPETPVVFIESFLFANTVLDGGSYQIILEKNKALRAGYEKLKAEGVKGLYYISLDEISAQLAEGTVDGVHLTDLGFMRFAEFLKKHFSRLPD